MPLLPKPDADARLVKLRATLLAAVMVLADTDGDGEQRLSQLRKLVRLIRPTRREAELPGLRLAQLALVLRTETTARRALRNALLALLAEKHSVHLFSDAGVLSSEGFSSSLSRRIWHRVLPDVVNTDYLKDVLGLLFDRRDDHEWMEAAGAEAWLDLVRAIDIDHGASHDKGKLALQIVSAIEVLSYRITSIGLEPELVRNYPAIERHESPFLTQNAEVRHFVDEWRKAATDKRDPQLDSRQIDVLLEQCTEIIGKIRKQARRTGASVSLTYQLVRLEQSIARFSQLMKLLEAPPAERNALSVSLFFELVIAENRRYSIGDLFSQNIELLAQRVTGSAGRMGEKYIANSRTEFWALLRAALGAGFFIALMAGTKLLFGFGEHAPIVTAFVNSMIYGLGFVVIYLVGFTVATKQPAMTAATIAASIRSTEAHPDRLEGLANLVVATLRSQFIAIIGNLVLAFVTAALVGYLIWTYGGAHFLPADKAHHLLEDLDPFRSPAIAHAAIAGICLFFSGLISGYFDNRAAYTRIPERIAQRPKLQRWLGKARARALGDYIGHNLGGIAGNFFFGCMLGSMGTLGFILGLPLDIRHIAFAAANYAYALVSLDWAVLAPVALWSGLGVLIIGMTNLAVSFGLALFVAMRSQRVEFTEGRRLAWLVMGHFVRAPQRFIWPPRTKDADISEVIDTVAQRVMGPPGPGGA